MSTQLIIYIGLGVLILLIFMGSMARMFRKAGPNEALIVYGFRGPRVIKGHGAVIFPVIETRVTDQDMAVAVGFLGSPTVRINGLDIEPSARHRTPFGMMCRTYDHSGCLPSDELIRNAMVESRKSE